MARWDLPLEDCLRALDGVDRGELVPETVDINRAPETMRLQDTLKSNRAFQRSTLPNAHRRREE